MAASSYRHLYLWNDWAKSLSIVKTGAAGSWPAHANISFLIVGHAAESETDADGAGYAHPGLSQSSLLEGQSTSLNDKLVASWTIERGEPDHWAIYYQLSATWDWTQNATKCNITGGGDIDGGLSTVQILHTSAGTLAGNTLSAAVRSVRLNNVVNISHTEREAGIEGCDGVIAAESRTFNSVLLPSNSYSVQDVLLALELQAKWGACSISDKARLRKWLRRAYPVVLVDASDSSNSVYANIYGYLTRAPFGSTTADASALMQLGMRVVGVGLA